MKQTPIHTEALVVALGVVQVLADDTWAAARSRTDMWDTLFITTSHITDRLRKNASADVTVPPSPQQELDL